MRHYWTGELRFTMLIQRLIQSIRNTPGAILRLIRVILLPMVLRGAGMFSKSLHLRPNSSASPSSSHMECEPSRRVASRPTIAASSAPASSTLLLPSGSQGDSADHLFSSMPSAVNAPDIPLITPCVAPAATLNAKPAAPEYFQRYERRKPV